MPSQKGPSRGSALTALVWAYHQGILNELVPEFSCHLCQQPDDLLVREESAHVESLEELFLVDSCRLEFCERLISSFAELYDDDPHIYDAYHLAESLDGHNRTRARVLNRDDGTIYIENFKYENALQSVQRPFVPVVNFLLNPQIYPFIDHYHLENILWSLLDKDLYRSLAYLMEELAKKGHFITKDFLTNYLRNHPDFLVLEIEGRRFAGTIGKLLPTWKLAAELIPDDEYIRIKGNRWRDKIGLDEISYEVKTLVLVRFFTFHGVKKQFDLINPTEVALKMRFHRRRRLATIQNIPSNIYNFIVEWIQENRAVWQTRRSRSLLGYPFEFDPCQIPPGELLIYGGNPRFLNRGETALVLREMVSEVRQERHKIHPSRVMSGSAAYDFNPSDSLINGLLSLDQCFKSYGVLDARTIAHKLLVQMQILASPYYKKQAVKAIQSHVSAHLEPVGKDIFVTAELSENFEQFMSLAERRKSVLSQIFPQYPSLAELCESLPQEIANVAQRLAY